MTLFLLSLSLFQSLKCDLDARSLFLIGLGGAYFVKRLLDLFLEYLWRISVDRGTIWEFICAGCKPQLLSPTRPMKLLLVVSVGHD